MLTRIYTYIYTVSGKSGERGCHSPALKRSLNVRLSRAMIRPTVVLSLTITRYD